MVADVRCEPRFRWLEGVDQARFVAMCSVPIVSGDRLVGALNVQADTARHFSAADVDLLGEIAAQVAGIIERSELQQRLEARIEDLRRARDQLEARISRLAVTRNASGS